MSREIKFRAWNKEKKIMCYDNEGSSSCYWGGAYPFEVGIINRYMNLPECLRDCEYMQYIGVLDKNGKEIYEGDIVKLPAWMTNHGDYAVCKYTDLSSDTYPIIGFAFFDLKGNLVDSDEWDEYEVIGNVYENSDLLEEAGNE